jgi:hypothetical protein
LKGFLINNHPKKVDYKLTLKGAPVLHAVIVFTPFHVAEQDVNHRQFRMPITRPAVDQVIRLHFLLVRFLYASKENEHKKIFQ